jgi:glycerophosphoryl diester phosphodiesterase
MKLERIFRIGHRGAAGHAPENTLAAVEKGIALGVDFVEMDIQRTRDGNLVCIHDKFVDRTTNGTGAVRDLCLDDLRMLDAGDGQRVPTLTEVLAVVSGRAGVLLETISPGTGPELLRAVTRFGIRSPVIFSSFIHSELAAIRQIDSTAKTMALLEGIPLNMTGFALEANVTHVGLSIDSISQEYVDALHDTGVQVFVYTVNEPYSIQMAMSLGVDGLISDYPDRF